MWAKRATTVRCQSRITVPHVCRRGAWCSSALHVHFGNTRLARAATLQSFVLGDGAKRHDLVRTWPGPAPSFTSGLLPTRPRHADHACWWNMPRRCSLSKRFHVHEADTSIPGTSVQNFRQRNVILRLCAGEDATSAGKVRMPSLRPSAQSHPARQRNLRCIRW